MIYILIYNTQSVSISVTGHWLGLRHETNSKKLRASPSNVNFKKIKVKFWFWVQIFVLNLMKTLWIECYFIFSLILLLFRFLFSLKIPFIRIKAIFFRLRGRVLRAWALSLRNTGYERLKKCYILPFFENGLQWLTI